MNTPMRAKTTPQIQKVRITVLSIWPQLEAISVNFHGLKNDSSTDTMTMMRRTIATGHVAPVLARVVLIGAYATSADTRRVRRSPTAPVQRAPAPLFSTVIETSLKTILPRIVVEDPGRRRELSDKGDVGSSIGWRGGVYDRSLVGEDAEGATAS